MTAAQLPQDEIDDPFHPSCYLLLLQIDASSTCAPPAQSDMVMKTYGAAGGRAGSWKYEQREERTALT